jgi:HEAT repeat protein
MGLKPDLEKMEAERDFKRLLRTLKIDEDNNIRYKAAEALIKLGWHPKNTDEKSWYDSALIGKSTALCPKCDAKSEAPNRSRAAGYSDKMMLNMLVFGNVLELTL